MNLKVKLIHKDTHQESSDMVLMQNLKKDIKQLITDRYVGFDCNIKIYGEIIPFNEI